MSAPAAPGAAQEVVEVARALGALAALELAAVRLTDGPLPPFDLILTALGWDLLLLLAFVRPDGPRRVAAVGLAGALLHVTLGPALTLGPLPTGLAALAAAGVGLALSRAAPAEGALARRATTAWVLTATAVAVLDGIPTATILALGALGIALLTVAARSGPLAALLLLTAAAAALPAPRRPAPSDAPDLLVVTVDAWRADVALAGRATRHLAEAGEGATGALWTPAPWTLPAMASLATGLSPHVHGAGRRADGFAGPGAHPTWAERLRDAGWQTHLVSAGNPFTGAAFGLTRGFDRVDHPWAPTAHPLPRGRAAHGRPRTWPVRLAHALLPSPRADDAPALLAEARRRLTLPGGPHAVHVHLMDLHLPLAEDPCGGGTLTAAGARAAVEADPFFQTAEGHACWRRAYRQAAERVDAALLATLQGLDLGRTAVLLTADHGEAFGDEAFEHGDAYVPSVLRIPLAVGGALPATPALHGGLQPARPRRWSVPEGATLADVGATLAAWALAEPLPGRPLLDAPTLDGPVLLGDGLHGPPRRGVVLDGWLLEEVGGHETIRLWAGAADAPVPPPVDALRAALPPWGPQGPAGPLSAEDRHALEALGYLRPETDPP